MFGVVVGWAGDAARGVAGAAVKVSATDGASATGEASATGTAASEADKSSASGEGLATGEIPTVKPDAESGEVAAPGSLTSMCAVAGGVSDVGSVALAVCLTAVRRRVILKAMTPMVMRTATPAMMMASSKKPPAYALT